jgi:hypothetical protein
LNVVFRARCLTNKDSIAQVKKVDLDSLPIVVFGEGSPVTKAQHDRVVELVDKMLVLVPKLRSARTESDRGTFQNAVTTAQRKIDETISALYCLTQGEIELLEV